MMHVGDIMSTVGVFSTGGYHDTGGGYHDACGGDILSTVRDNKRRVLDSLSLFDHFCGASNAIDVN